jgi:hypothetical protein
MPANFRGFAYYKGHPGVTRKLFATEAPKVYEDAVSYWHDEFLPLHFEAGNRQRYPGAIKFRTKEHFRRSRAKNGVFIPLVFTGNLRDEATRSAEIKGNQKGAQAKFRIPRYAYVIYRTGIDMIDEMTVTNDAEADRIAVLIDEKLNERILEASARVVTKKTV